MRPCPSCGSTSRQEYRWKPDHDPTRERHLCHDCKYDSGWCDISRNQIPAKVTPHQCARCLRKKTFDGVWHCPCGCSYRRLGNIIQVWDVNMVEEKRPEWAQRETQGTLL